MKKTKQSRKTPAMDRERLPVSFTVAPGFTVKIRGVELPSKESRTVRRIREFIEGQMSEGELVDGETLAVELGLMRTTISAYAAAPGLKAFQFVQPGRVTYWGRVDTVAKMRKAKL